MALLNLSGKHFNVPKPPEYYSLETNRVHRNRKAELTYDEEYRVAGTEEQLYRFRELNHLNKDESENIFCRMLQKLHLMEKKTHYQTVEPVRTKNINKLPFNELENLGEFSLFGLRGHCRIVDVIDGDTFSVALFVPFVFLTEKRSNDQASIIPYGSMEGFFSRWRCRLMGVDAIEIHDPKTQRKGQEAKNFVINIFEQHHKVMEFQALGFDKYGRLLIELFLRDGRNIVDELVKHRDLFNVYEGKTKCGFA